MSNKTIVVGMKERGGRIETQIVPNVRTESLRPVVLESVEKVRPSRRTNWRPIAYSKAMGTSTARWTTRARNGLGPIIKTEWASTNSTESFWDLFQASVAGTHIHISHKHLDRYLGEFSFRSNFREMRNAMFDLLIAAL